MTASPLPSLSTDSFPAYVGGHLNPHPRGDAHDECHVDQLPAGSVQLRVGSVWVIFAHDDALLAAEAIRRAAAI